MKKTCHENRQASVENCMCHELDDILECPSEENLKQILEMEPKYQKLKEEALEEAALEVEKWEDQLKQAKALAKDAKSPQNRAKVEKARCDLTCFCRTCKDKIPEIAKGKCVGFEAATDCECDEELDCKDIESEVDCSMKCICDKCGEEREKLKKVGLDHFEKSCGDFVEGGKKSHIKKCDCEKTSCDFLKVPDHMVRDEL